MFLKRKAGKMDYILGALFFVVVLFCGFFIFYWAPIINEQVAENQRKIAEMEKREIDNFLSKDRLESEDKERIFEILAGEKALRFNLSEEERLNIMKALNN